MVTLMATVIGMVLCAIGALFFIYRNIDLSESEPDSTDAKGNGKESYGIIVVIRWLFYYREELEEVKIENVV